MTHRKNGIFALLVCWFAYFTVPVVNNIGVFNGVYVMLCATKGVMIHSAPSLSDSSRLSDASHLHHANLHAHHQMSQHADHHAHHMGVDDIGSTDQSAEDHEAEGCPCIHFFFDTSLFLATEIGFVRAFESIADTLHVSPITAIYAAQARGPPALHYAPHFLKQHT
ncbi:MAG: hypothetical protein ABJE79_09555 [Marinomonas sp.]